MRVRILDIGSDAKSFVSVVYAWLAESKEVARNIDVDETSAFTDVGDPQAQFQPIADFARQGFQQQTIPALSAAAGFGGGARSSGFQDILAREGRNLELGLAAQFAPFQQQSIDRQFQLPTQLANLGAAQQAFPAAQRAFGLEQFFAADPSRNPALALTGPAFQSAFDTAVFQGFRQPGLAEQLLPAVGSLFGGAGAAGGFSKLFG